jgi:hypothetical protein
MAAELSTDKVHGKSAKRMLAAGTNIVWLTEPHILNMAQSMLGAPCMVVARNSTHDASTIENVDHRTAATRRGRGTPFNAVCNLGILIKAPRHD